MKVNCEIAPHFLHKSYGHQNYQKLPNVIFEKQISGVE